MERSHAFETVLVLILIGLIGLLLFMIVYNPQPAKGWEMQSNGSIDYMFTGSDDTLYVFQGNNITAIGSDGGVAWSLHVPDEWKAVQRLDNGFPNPIAAEADGALYLFLSRTEPNSPRYPSDPVAAFYSYNISAEVVAISPDGTYLWEHPFAGRAFSLYYMNSPADYQLSANAVIQAVNGRVLVFHDFEEDVLDSNGKLLFTIDNVSGPMAVDAGGRMYGVVAGKPGVPLNNSTDFLDWDYRMQLSHDSRFIGEDFNRIPYDDSYLIKTDIIDAYDSDGMLLWSKEIGERVTGTYDDFAGLQPVFRSLPLLAGDMLYVPVDNGTAAIGTDGELKWIRHPTGANFYPFLPLPVDDKGNVYMEGAIPAGPSYVCTISPDGTISHDAWEYDMVGGSYTEPVARGDGTAFLITHSTMFPLEAFNRTMQGGPMTIDTLTAYNISSRQALWSFNAPAEDVHRITLNASNAAQASPWNSAYFLTMNTAQMSYAGQPIDAPQILPMEDHRITINPGKNVVYLSDYSIMFEMPVIFDSSRAVYVNSLYALDYNGTLLWKRPLDGFVTHAVARNDTFYYSTNGGQIGGNTVNVAAGIAMAAVAYVFLRFFVLGTVARARTRIESNRNRNDLLKFVNENPGVTAVDISRGLKMNLGTVRYHLFILAANHKIVPHKDDSKFLRYFRNSGAYSPEERSWLSLMRREPIRKVIAALERNPGQSTQQLAQELDMSPTAVHNHISELSARGIVDRAQSDDRGYAYTIKDEYHPYIMKTMERL